MTTSIDNAADSTLESLRLALLAENALADLVMHLDARNDPRADAVQRLIDSLRIPRKQFARESQSCTAVQS